MTWAGHPFGETVLILWRLAWRLWGSAGNTKSQLVIGLEGHLLSLSACSLPVSRTGETSLSATPWHAQLPELQPEAQSSPQPDLEANRGYHSTQRLLPLCG